MVLTPPVFDGYVQRLTPLSPNGLAPCESGWDRAQGLCLREGPILGGGYASVFSTRSYLGRGHEAGRIAACAKPGEK